MRILVSNCESAKHGAICRTYVQTTRHAFGEIFRCRACTKHLENFAEYVTTVTTMSSEGAKSACLVVWLAGHKATKKKEKQEKSCL